MISGYGLHTGVPSWVRLHPAEGPVRFRRGQVEIPAQIGFVVDTLRSTTLGSGGYRVATVEHLLAALYVGGWWQGLVVEVSADELPILDGSAAPWLELVSSLGPPPAPLETLKVEAPFFFNYGESLLKARPGAFRLCAEIHFDHPAIGSQRWCGGRENCAELLPARTFGFLSDLEKLRAQGLATAASLENAIVYGGEGPLAALRFEDEPVRHKALDALGDLYLLGRPLLGEVDILRGSHSAHVAFVRALLEEAMLLSLLPSP